MAARHTLSLAHDTCLSVRARQSNSRSCRTTADGGDLVLTRVASNMDVFTPEEDEKLIELVSRHPILYDTKHSDFKDQHLKDSIWRGINKELNKSGESCCKRHWRNIRDGYARFKRCKSATRDGPKNPRSKWQFYKLLSFLDSVAQEKSGTSTNIEETSTNNDPDSQDYSFRAEFINIESPDVNKTGTDAMANFSIASTSRFNELQKRQRVENTDNFSSLIEYFKQRDAARQSLKASQAQPNDTNNDIVSFSTHVKDILKKLPPNLQISAKKDIFDILFKYEMMAMNQERPHSNNLASGSRSSNFNSYELPVSFYAEPTDIPLKGNNSLDEPM